MTWKKNFSLKWLLLVMLAFGVFFGAYTALQLYGVVIAVSLVFACFLLTAPAEIELTQRILVFFISSGATILSWIMLHGLGWSNIVPGWGPLDEIGGWATGVLVGAWRMSQLAQASSKRA